MQLELSSLAFAFPRLGSTLFALDAAILNTTLLLHHFAQLDLLLLFLDHAHLELSPLLQSVGQSDTSFTPFGMSRLASNLSALDAAFLGFAVPFHSGARLWFSLSVIDLLHLDFSPFLQSPSLLGLRYFP